jgi:two-component system response regulator
MDNRFILLVEDNPDDAALTLRAFKKVNIANQVIVCRDGAEALDFLFARNAYSDRDPNDQPSVILLDLKLPKIDGLEVLQALRNDERTKHLRVVVLTSSREEQDIIQSYDLGANSYIRKPVDFDKFLTAVGQLGLYWLLLNEGSQKDIG